MPLSFYSPLRHSLGPAPIEAERTARIEVAPPQRPRAPPPQRPTAPRPPPAATCSRKLQGLTVAVVGGGFAGLMAARTLCRQGVDVTVFEARPQVGGRVLSDYGSFSAGRITEAGAELVGSIHTRWCALAIEYGLALVSRMNAELYRGQQLKVKMTLDKPLDMDEIRAIEKEKEEKVLRPIARLASRLIRDPSRPWDEPNPAVMATLKKADNMSVAQAMDAMKVPRGSRLWLAMELLLVNNNVKSLDELNFLGLLCLVKGGQTGTIDKKDALMGYWNELEIYRCADGCQTLAFKIATDIQSSKYRCVVRLRRAVTEINLEKPTDGKPVSVTTKPVVIAPGGKVVYGQPKVEGFDYVVFAIPPSVWADVVFKPERLHPKRTVGVMETGPAVKFFSDVTERFWIKDGAAPYGGSLPLGQVWEGTDNQTRVGKQGIVLSVFAGGRSTMPNEKDFQRELTTLYPSYLRYLNKPLFANWPKQPFIMAGYVSPGKKQVLTVGKLLNEPYQGRLFFAGEHTQMDHFGYMEGALRSGERAAGLLMQLACKPPETVASVARRREAELSW